MTLLLPHRCLASCIHDVTRPSTFIMSTIKVVTMGHTRGPLICALRSCVDTVQDEGYIERKSITGRFCGIKLGDH